MIGRGGVDLVGRAQCVTCGGQRGVKGKSNKRNVYLAVECVGCGPRVGNKKEKE